MQTIQYHLQKTLPSDRVAELVREVGELLGCCSMDDIWKTGGDMMASSSTVCVKDCYVDATITLTPREAAHVAIPKGKMFSTATIETHRRIESWKALFAHGWQPVMTVTQ